MPSKPIVALAVRYLLGGLMLWAAVSKLANPTAFLGSLYAYELPLPQGFLKLVAVILPWMELLCGLMLLANAWPETTLLVTAALFGVFLLATAQAAGRGLEISCGCFDLGILGLSEATSGAVRFFESPAFAFLRNMVLLAGVVWLLRNADPARGDLRLPHPEKKALDKPFAPASLPALSAPERRKRRSRR